MTRWLWFIKKTVGRLWFRASVFCLIAAGTALIALYFKSYIPENFSQKIGADAVDGILNIIASSMLAVTTFSLSTMVAAYSASTNNVTPRSTQLLLEDTASHNALSTFIGAFIFSLVSIVTLKMGVYGDSGRLILFVVTIAVIFFIIFTLIRWIEYLSRLGRVSETMHMVERVTRNALIARAKRPSIGAQPYTKEIKARAEKAKPLYIKEIGYLQLIDMSRLSDIAKENDGTIYVQVQAGNFCTPDKPVAYIENISLDDCADQIADAFVVARERTYDQDPRFGLIVLSEIASRALSPAVNDPGTAIQILGASVRLISEYFQTRQENDADIPYTNLYAPSLDAQDMCDDMFKPIARDGAGMVEVGLRLQKALASLAALGDPDLEKAAAQSAAYALAYARQSSLLPDDIARLEALAQANGVKI